MKNQLNRLPRVIQLVYIIYNYQKFRAVTAFLLFYDRELINALDFFLTLWPGLWKRNICWNQCVAHGGVLKPPVSYPVYQNPVCMHC